MNPMHLIITHCGYTIRFQTHPIASHGVAMSLLHRFAENITPDKQKVVTHCPPKNLDRNRKSIEAIFFF